MNTKKSLTGNYLSGEKFIPLPAKRRKPSKCNIEVVEAAENNLKNVSAKFPIGLMIVVSNVSDSGISTLVNDILFKCLTKIQYRRKHKLIKNKKEKEIKYIEKIINIDQSPIGRTPRSNPATYTSLFDDVRDVFAQTNEAKIRGYKKGRFSFNVKGGRCEACRGDGI